MEIGEGEGRARGSRLKHFSLHKQASGPRGPLCCPLDLTVLQSRSPATTRCSGTLRGPAWRLCVCYCCNDARTAGKWSPTEPGFMQVGHSKVCHGGRRSEGSLTSSIYWAMVEVVTLTWPEKLPGCSMWNGQEEAVQVLRLIYWGKLNLCTVVKAKTVKFLIKSLFALNGVDFLLSLSFMVKPSVGAEQQHPEALILKPPSSPKMAGIVFLLLAVLNICCWLEVRMCIPDGR